MSWRKRPTAPTDHSPRVFPSTDDDLACPLAPWVVASRSGALRCERCGARRERCSPSLAAADLWTFVAAHAECSDLEDAASQATFRHHEDVLVAAAPELWRALLGPAVARGEDPSSLVVILLDPRCPSVPPDWRRGWNADGTKPLVGAMMETRAWAENYYRTRMPSAADAIRRGPPPGTIFVATTADGKFSLSAFAIDDIRAWAGVAP